ncbi:glycosyltransferase [Dyella choica]|uniref:Glycosyltransferase n=1 Tax=Dyella choica TaxID=1927959 RepID=A0A3S0PH61_9GAMM|nr:glycosyltransferase [Dyella choica]RUL73106.1 glycosyltransferase [Dyella choica]
MPLSVRLIWRFRRLNYILQRFRGSVALRGWRGTLARVRQEFERRPAFDDSLPVEPLEVPFKPFALPISNQPVVSVIIPIHGKIAYTLACLRSLVRHVPGVPFEVILVDDASPDNSVERLAEIAGLRLLRNERNLGFISACNAGAAVAHGEFLVFLNNDTQVMPNWLDGLLCCFDDHDDCGIAGSRLVYPDGRLQEAGGLVFIDGSCWTSGRFEHRDAPRWQYRREVDYVSGASLMIRRKVFEQVGGFDNRYAPAYYEDADLAFTVRQLGLKVYYEPSSTVIHCEGISAGTDLHVGMKRHQLTNQAIFVAKWRETLRNHPPADTSLPRALHWRRRGQILVVDSMTPDPTRDSGSLRLSAILRLLDEQGWSVSFFPDDGRASEEEVRALGALGTEVLCRPWVTDLPDWLHTHGSELRAVMLCRHTVAGQYASLVRKLAPKARVLFDTVDLHFLREHRAAELSGSASMARQAQASRKSELALIGQCDVTFVVSEHERTLLAAELPHANIELLSNIHEIHDCRRPHEIRRDFVFIGGFGHPPNADAVRWIATEILPALREQLPEARIHVLGDAPDTARAELLTPGLEFHGRVPDLAPWLDSALASLAPLRFGAGVKGKINMAMSYGVPVIATPLAVEGMHLVQGQDVLLADTAQGFAQASEELQQDGELWRRLSAASIDNVKRHFSPRLAYEALERALGSANN